MEHSKMTKAGGYCPSCGVEWKMEIKTPVKENGFSSDKPPGVGDRVIKPGWPRPREVQTVTPNYIHITGLHVPIDSAELNSLKVVRRSTDLLQKGDRGLLDGKIEVWMDAHMAIPNDNRIRVLFDGYPGGPMAEHAWINPDRFTLTEPVFKPKED